MLKQVVTTFTILLFGFGFAQNHNDTSHHSHKKNEISLLIGHAHVSEGIEAGKTQWLVLPSWMLSYNRKLSDKWLVGIHSDIIIEEFVVENGDEELIERSRPIALVAAATYKPLHYLGIIAGGGVEYAKNESFGLLRFGVEPMLKINSNFEAALNLSYDIKVNAYNSWGLGIGIAYLFN